MSNISSEQLVCAALAYEAITRKIATMSRILDIDHASTVEHIDQQLIDTDAENTHVYSIETDYVATIQTNGRPEHQFSIDVRVCDRHFSAAIFLAASGDVRWTGEVTEFQAGVPSRSFRMVTVPATW